MIASSQVNELQTPIFSPRGKLCMIDGYEHHHERFSHSEHVAGRGECKNGSCSNIKHMGHWHIPKYEARKINGFYRDCFNEFLCFHRMCAYPTTIVLDNGKKKKVYEDIMTPVQKLLSIPNVERYLKEDVTIESLKEKMTRMSHLENAKIMHENKQKLFAAIKKC